MRMLILAGLGLSTALISCAPTSGGAGGEAATVLSARQCFNSREVQDFRQGRFDQVFLRARDDVYELRTVGCEDLKFTNRLALAPEAGGLSGTGLCAGDWARVVAPQSASVNSVCRVRVGSKLTAQQLAGLPAAYQP